MGLHNEKNQPTKEDFNEDDYNEILTQALQNFDNINAEGKTIEDEKKFLEELFNQLDSNYTKLGNNLTEVNQNFSSQGLEGEELIHNLLEELKKHFIELTQDNIDEYLYIIFSYLNESFNTGVLTEVDLNNASFVEERNTKIISSLALKHKTNERLQKFALRNKQSFYELLLINPNDITQIKEYIKERLIKFVSNEKLINLVKGEKSVAAVVESLQEIIESFDSYNLTDIKFIIAFKYANIFSQYESVTNINYQFQLVNKNRILEIETKIFDKAKEFLDSEKIDIALKGQLCNQFTIFLEKQTEQKKLRLLYSVGLDKWNLPLNIERNFDVIINSSDTNLEDIDDKKLLLEAAKMLPSSMKNILIGEIEELPQDLLALMAKAMKEQIHLYAPKTIHCLNIIMNETPLFRSLMSHIYRSIFSEETISNFNKFAASTLAPDNNFNNELWRRTNHASLLKLFFLEFLQEIDFEFLKKELKEDHKLLELIVNYVQKINEEYAAYTGKVNNNNQASATKIIDLKEITETFNEEKVLAEKEKEEKNKSSNSNSTTFREDNEKKDDENKERSSIFKNPEDLFTEKKDCIMM
ncbi:MAG: hypothetical protein J0H68_03700 [Sphingobacteriia bacterium]|nr:hypothetical protein [Sphingobacteriia bacterium]